MAAGDVVNTAARLQAAAPVNGDPRRRAGLPGHGAGDRLPRGGAGGRQGKERADSAPGRRSRRARASASTCSRRRRAARRPRTRARAARLDAGTRARGALAAAGDARRRARDRQEPARLRAPPDRRRRSPSFVRWRQGRSLPYGEGVTFWALAEIVKAQAGILESDSARAGRGEASHAPSAESGVDATEAQWLERHLRPLAGVAEEGSAEPGGGRSPPGAASSRRWPRSGRSCSCSRTSTGPTTPCSTSSTSWSSGRAASRCSCSARRAPSSCSAGRAGAAASRTRSRSRCRRSRTRRPPGSLQTLLERPLRRAETQEALLARAGGNPLYAEQYARILLERGDVLGAPGDGAGHHRRAARRALGGGEAAAPGRRGGRQGLLAGRGRGGRRL